MHVSTQHGAQPFLSGGQERGDASREAAVGKSKNNPVWWVEQCSRKASGRQAAEVGQLKCK